MLSQLDPTLVTSCDEIAARGGAVKAPPRNYTFPPLPPVVYSQVHGQDSRTQAMPPVTRASARLRGVAPVAELKEEGRAVGRRRGSDVGVSTGTGLELGMAMDMGMEIGMEYSLKLFHPSSQGKIVRF